MLLIIQYISTNAPYTFYKSPMVLVNPLASFYTNQAEVGDLVLEEVLVALRCHVLMNL